MEVNLTEKQDDRTESKKNSKIEAAAWAGDGIGMMTDEILCNNKMRGKYGRVSGWGLEGYLSTGSESESARTQNREQGTGSSFGEQRDRDTRCGVTGAGTVTS